MRDVSQPVQARSRATLARIAGAAEALMAEKGFAAATVDDIVDRAGSSKGAFYTRFRSKEALLRYLGTVHFEQALDGWSRFSEPRRWRDRTLAEIVHALVARLVGIYRRRGPLMRAFVIHARYRRDPDIAALGQRLNRHVGERLEALLAPRLAARGHPAPGRAVRFALTAVSAAARDLILFADADAVSDADDGLSEELAALFLGYLDRTAERSPS